MNSETYTFDENILSDLYKDAYGIRPRSEEFWSEWESADNDGKQRIWDRLVDALGASIREEKKRQEKAINMLEDRIAFMRSTVIDCTREDAIRYLDDIYECGGDRAYLEYCLGVPYGYFS